MPKTGGTFVTTVLKEVYQWHNLSFLEKQKRRLRLNNNRTYSIKLISEDNHPLTGEKVMQHGAIKDIPSNHQNKPVVSIVRNPFDRYVSQFEFNWWKSYPIVDPSIIQGSFPDYPELSFSQYLQMANTIYREKLSGQKHSILGLQSVQFIWFYCTNPLELYQLDDKQSILKEVVSQISTIRFLRQESLRSDLINFLRPYQWSKKVLRRVEDKPKIIPPGPGKLRGKGWKEYYTKEELYSVQENEWLLFELFPEYRIS